MSSILVATYPASRRASPRTNSNFPRLPTPPVLTPLDQFRQPLAHRTTSSPHVLQSVSSKFRTIWRTVAPDSVTDRHEAGVGELGLGGHMFPPWMPVRAAQFFFLILLLQTTLFRSKTLKKKRLQKSFPGKAAKKAWLTQLESFHNFVDDWNWTLAVLQRLSPSTQRPWQWREALADLRATPSTMLNM